MSSILICGFSTSGSLLPARIDQKVLAISSPPLDASIWTNVRICDEVPDNFGPGGVVGKILIELRGNFTHLKMTKADTCNKYFDFTIYQPFSPINIKQKQKHKQSGWSSGMCA